MLPASFVVYELLVAICLHAYSVNERYTCAHEAGKLFSSELDLKTFYCRGCLQEQAPNSCVQAKQSLQYRKPLDPPKLPAANAVGHGLVMFLVISSTVVR